MSYFGNSDFMLEVAKGNIPGHAVVNKFGRNPTIGAGLNEAVWDGSTVYTFPTTVDITHLRQAVDQTAMRGQTIEVQGLDTNYDLVVQNVTLNASDTTTPVALATAGTALRRVFRMKVLANVVTTQNIELRNVGGGTTYAVITAGYNQTMMAIYTVPAGKTAYVTHYYMSSNKVAGGGSPEIIARLWMRDNTNTYAPQIKHIIGTDSDAATYVNHDFKPYFKVEEKSDIWVNAEEITATGGVIANIAAGFDLILVDN